MNIDTDKTASRAGAAGTGAAGARRSRVAAGLAGVPMLLAAAAASAELSVISNIIDLQPSKQVSELVFEDEGGRGIARLTNLNPRINGWYLLQVERGAGPPADYHLENPAPRHQKLRLDPLYSDGVLIELADERPVRCTLWSGTTPALQLAQRSGVSFAPLCDGRLYLRNRATGYRTSRELVTEVLRDRVWGGEKIISFIRDRVLRDAHLERAPPAKKGGHNDLAQLPGGPLPARVNPSDDGLRALPAGLGIEPELAVPGRVAFGAWYPARLVPDVYVSIMQASLVDTGLLASYPARVRQLDATEAAAVVYLVAFPLERFELGFEIGTDHPRVGWSERSLPAVRNPASPGPDGIGTIAPLVGTGIVNPADLPRTVATFTGGFKRSHSAFRYGELALVNAGSHYGWIQHGVVFSRLQPALATMLVMDDGSFDLKAWRKEDQALLPDIVHARQNGVPILEIDPSSGETVPGSLVNNWGAGNWSGSAEGSLRTVRAGTCLQAGDGGGYLIYGYFSSVTPSAMARVFQAYRCRSAMLLDMNALEHTYLALYRIADAEVVVQHLVKGMEEVDKAVKGQPVPRFIGYPDNRDFFIVKRRQEVDL